MLNRGTRLWFLLLSIALAGCGQDANPPTADAPPPDVDGAGQAPPRPTEAEPTVPDTALLDPHRVGAALLPHIRVDAEARVVQIEGVVAINAFVPDAPDAWLELIACSPDSREHESLVVTRARPSDIHAALLLIGLEPGSPGGWVLRGASGEAVAVPTRGTMGIRGDVPEDAQMVQEAPSGAVVGLEFVYPDADGTVRRADPKSWIMSPGGAPPPDLGGFVFAGSREVVFRGDTVYDADGTGVIIGLTTFGSEVIAPRTVVSPNENMDPASFLADPGVVPIQGTPVLLEIKPAG